MTKIATSNLKRSMSWEQVRHELDRMMASGVGVMGLQEIYGSRVKRVKQYLANKGYGVVMQNDVPIAYNAHRYQMIDSGSETIGHDKGRTRSGNWVALVDRRTGGHTVITNTHLSPGPRAGGQHRRAGQIRQLAQLQRELRHRFGDQADFYLTGDLNTTNAHELQPLSQGTGLRGTHMGPLDWIFGESSANHSRLMANASDHDALIARYNDPARYRQQQQLHDEAQSGGTHHGQKNGGKDGNGMNQTQQSAFAYMMGILREYGLASLSGVLKHLILGGTTEASELTLALQDTKEWKTRFAGNEILRKNGQSVLSVSEYLATERSYAQIMKNAGVPQGFFDHPDDFAKWIGNGVSANELQQRVTAYSDLAKREDPAIIAQLKSMGMSQGDILAYLMDAKRSMPLLQQKFQQTLIGAAARRNGLAGDNDYLKHLADLGVTEEQANQGYGLISENLADMERLGSIYGEQYGQHDFEQEVFENNGEAANKRKRLASQERAAFGGSSGVGQGSLTRQTKGSY